MPIKERTLVDIREEMALRALDERYRLWEVAEIFGTTIPTVRLWRDRYRDGGRAALVDRSHAPMHPRRAIDKEIEAWIIADRQRWGFGSKKILRRLQDAFPERGLPARSSIDELLARHGLNQRRRRKSSSGKPFAARYEAKEPGELSTIDFKGQFRLRNGHYCYPLTMADRISRYLLAFQALRSTSFDETWPIVEKVFRKYGIPFATQSDNGPPFGATNGKFSRFSVELMSLEIQPIFSRPGVPQDNGAHEQKHAVMTPFLRDPRSPWRQQQGVFDAFQYMYNHERPHEGIGMDRPGERYSGSPRPYPRRRPVPEYELHWEKRKVQPSGEIKWRQDQIFVGHALAGRTIAFEATDVDVWTVHFHSFRIGKFDAKEKKFV